jgi:hypothetical protein
MPEEIILGTGALEDKPDERDFRYEELVAKAPVIKWVEKPQKDWNKFPIRYQNGSGTCVAQAVGKLLGTENYREEKLFPVLSALDIYDRRSNKPNEGMYGREGMLLGAKHGATLEEFLPSQNMTEGEMNKPVTRTKYTTKVAEIIKGGAVIGVPNDIDAVADVLDKGKCLTMGINFGSGYNQAVPQLPTDGIYPYRHFITAVDRTLWQGKRAIIIDDSWGTSYGFNGQRVITEDWFAANKIYSVFYYEDLDNDWMDKKEEPKPQPSPTPNIERPRYEFKKDLRVGQNSKDVEMLQKCLQYLKFFPANQVCTGFFGGITLKSVKMFQEAYAKDILHPIGLSVGTGLVAKQTRAKLNELFNK